eukprot:m.232379 g.232379  ORF g.232379 m.232379 type:complete len:183 (-) comp26060_c0_seq1:6928-7476(-)
MSARSRGGGGSTVTRKKRERKKKVCPDGAECKYQHEHQHTGEYDHPPRGAPKEPKATTWGTGRSLGGHGSTATATPTQRGATSGSAGRALGGATAGKNKAGRRLGKDDRVRARVPGSSKLLQLQRSLGNAAASTMSTASSSQQARKPAHAPRDINAGLSEADAVAMAIAQSRGAADDPIVLD